jgi:hypothetical protein
MRSQRRYDVGRCAGFDGSSSIHACRRVGFKPGNRRRNRRRHSARHAGTAANGVMLARQVNLPRGRTMSAATKCLASFIPATALLAACAAPPPPQTTVVTAPAPPPPVVAGAFGAPLTAPPLSGSSIAPPPIAAPVPPRPLTPAETMAALAGNTAVGMTAAGDPYALHFTADGRERYRQGTFTDIGTWRVLPDGEFCMRLSQVSSNAEECYVLSQFGNLMLYQRPNGLDQGSLRILPGNPRGI